MLTALEFYNKLKEEISFLDIDKRIKDEPINLTAPQIEMLHKLFISWSVNLSEETTKNLIVDILKKPNSENGKVYEALVYAWLERQSIQYTPQFHVEQENCFKTSVQGYDADGIIKENNLVFDVKQFGLTLPHIETLKRKLQAELPEGFFLTISGGRNISTKDLETHFLKNIKKIAQCILDEKNKIYSDYIYRDDRFGLEFRVWDNSKNFIFTSLSGFDAYEWAENNEFYFMCHSSQFCINSAYVLFCPYDAQLTPLFSREDREFPFMVFRALCRRIFMNLTKMYERKINDFDGKARNDISVATAAKKISAIVFLDVSDEFDYQNCRMFVFTNPNADYKIPQYQINSLFRNVGATIEDFRYDNY